MPAPLSRDEMARVLKSTPLFESLDADSLQRLAAECRQRTYGKGQFLWYQGDPGDLLAVICAGLAKVVLTADSGDEIVLATLGRHDSLGELSVLDGSPRSASVVAVEPTTVLLLDRPITFDLMRQRPEIQDAVLRSLGRLVRHMTEQTGDLVFLDLAGRLAKILLRLGQPASEGDEPVVLDLGLSQSDLAAMVGATRPAVNRTLQSFVARGLITIDSQIIVLKDLPRLRSRART